ncbi:tetratricopeptide repeat protein [Sinorhizobium mexicanum]|uniref:tetratricopeptide repeat protein n=1 Tax=Sinorhizobium mexicanum TaxID=375549 RepID=UPI003CC90A58
MALGRFPEADTTFKRRLALAPRTDMMRFYLACLYGHTGRRDEARRYWQETLEVNPAFPSNMSGSFCRTGIPTSSIGRWTDRATPESRSDQASLSLAICLPSGFASLYLQLCSSEPTSRAILGIHSSGRFCIRKDASFVPVGKGDATIADSKCATSSPARCIAPFEYYTSTYFV